MPIEVTSRGFERYARFKDSYGAEIGVYESSAVSSSVWVSIDGGQIQAVMPNTRANLRLYEYCGSPVARRPTQVEGRPAFKPIPQQGHAHLNVDQAKKLVAALQEWISKQEGQ